MNLLVQPLAGLSSIERAWKISEEIFAISRPKAFRTQNNVVKYYFGVIDNGSEAVLQVPDPSVSINVHPENDLTELIGLFPNLSEPEKNGLVAYIKSSQSFPFQNIVPSDSIIVDDQYLIENGFYPEVE
jgi:hypothetical protein